MGKKRFLILTAIIAFLGLGYNKGYADSNNLTQVDVKKSSVADSIDVTFYTTGENSNSVVTRKGSNRYVVLLPNVNSSAISPTLANVKDLVANVNVKHVDDGIGGYTKVTFETTKPINIKTYTKKSSPLTQAQKDTQTIIAQNNAKPAATKAQTSEKPAVKTTQAKATETKPAVQKTEKVPAKQTANKTSTTPKLIPVEVPTSKIQPIKNNKSTDVKVQPKTQKATEQKAQPKAVENVQKPVAQAKNDFIDSNYVPKMKYDDKGNRLVNLEPRVSHANNSNVTDNNAKANAPEPISEDISSKTIIDNNLNQNEEQKSKFPYWILLVGGSVVTFGILYLVFDAMRHSSEKDSKRLQSFFTLSNKNQARRRRKEYYDIVNNNDLNWQEKYRLYTEKEKQNNPVTQNEDASFITNLGATQKAVIMPQEKNESQVSGNKFNKLIRKSEKSQNEILSEKLQAKISQMEHALAQTPKLKPFVETPSGVQSEDTSILRTFSDIKLKSFSKPLSLKETNRSLIENEQTVSNTNNYQEGKFVNLRKSPLSVNRRKSASSELNKDESKEFNNEYLTNNNGENQMKKEKENYLVSSLDEYLSILDNEASKPASKVSVAESLSSIKPYNKVSNSTGTTNPISKNSTSFAMGGGLIIKSGYNIDDKKGIYLVNIEGVSAVVGRINDKTFMLKKFDKIIDRPLQVRQEDDNVYIVRAGSYKCLVDVAEDKMGTLIEI